MTTSSHTIIGIAKTHPRNVQVRETHVARPQHFRPIRTKVTAIIEAYREWDDAYGEWLKISGQASEAVQVQ
ncbi:MAG: hypothetical protein NTV35_12180 [Chloroflexi bacterium]|nr:hypothetical protein [Chloroflexota bacterium]